MNPRIKLKWILLPLIWAGCILLCYFNVETIERILECREKKEVLQRDMTFWKSNEDKMIGVMERQKLLSQEIESLKMGIISLNDSFNKFAVDFNLTDLKMEMDSKILQGDSMPFRVSFNGTLKDGLAVMQEIQTKYTFLPFKSIKIEEQNTGDSTKFNISLNYKYHLKSI